MASSANVLNADLITALPARRAEHSRNAMSLELCPPGGAVLTAAERQRPRIELGQSQVSIVETAPAMGQALVRMLQVEGFSACTFASEHSPAWQKTRFSFLTTWPARTLRSKAHGWWSKICQSLCFVPIARPDAR